ncbi:hypothetical protein G9A89_020114 [Geosiphon pyriformis]|nr:hypothetical protein G9A89_020114 [Geosiphon pyriformis]
MSHLCMQSLSTKIFVNTLSKRVYYGIPLLPLKIHLIIIPFLFDLPLVSLNLWKIITILMESEFKTTNKKNSASGNTPLPVRTTSLRYKRPSTHISESPDLFQTNLESGPASSNKSRYTDSKTPSENPAKSLKNENTAIYITETITKISSPSNQQYHYKGEEYKNKQQTVEQNHLPVAARYSNMTTKSSDVNSSNPSIEKPHGRSQPPPPSPSHSIRSVQNFSHIHKKRFSRTIERISSFIQINANISPSISFPVTVEKTFSVERLARQIEAEYAFKFGGIEQVGSYEPLEVGLLYDVGMVALRFRDIVGDVLEHSDVVHVLNIYEGYNMLQDIDEYENSKKLNVVSPCGPGLEDSFSEIPSSPIYLSTQALKEQRRFSMPIIPNRHQSLANVKSTHFPIDLSVPSLSKSFISLAIPSDLSLPPHPTLQHIQTIIQASESRFQSLLSNTLSLNFFQRFTINEYSAENPLFWLDVELFAAGISCDGEDNYFDEQQTALIHAKYIYLTYISPNGPLQVNLSDEIRREIPWPLDDDCIVERDMFDEAQEAVYQLMKGHTFMRFEESKEWKECLRIKNEDPERYQLHEMTLSLDHYFRPNMPLMLAVTMALDNDAPPMPISHLYKEQTLHSTLSQYFPHSIQLDQTGKKAEENRYAHILAPTAIEGYFNSENRMTTAQRMRRIKKERKLRWVFGASIGQMSDQFKIGAQKTLLDEIDDSTSVTSSVLSANKKATKDVWQRKKKVEKLEAIFGRGLRDSQLHSQHIIKNKSTLNDSKESFTLAKKDPMTNRNIETKNSSISSPFSDFSVNSRNDSGDIRTANDLSAKDRRILLKKNKKLRVMLGETFDEKIVRKTLTLPTIQNSPNKDQFGYNRLDITDQLSSNIRNKLNRRASDSMVITPSSPIVRESLSPMTSPSIRLSNHQYNNSLRNSESWDKHISEAVKGLPLAIINKDTKEYRRKKIQKLYQFLGEKVPVNIILGDNNWENVSSSSTIIKNKLQKSRRPDSLYIHKTPNRIDEPNISDNLGKAGKLSAQDKKRHLKRAVKLEKMFGEIPPQNLFLSTASSRLAASGSPILQSQTSRLDFHRQSLETLNYLMENDRKVVYELIDYMTACDDDSSINRIPISSDDFNLNKEIIGFPRLISSAPATPLTSNMPFILRPPPSPVTKQNRVKGITKLSHFFGATYGQMFPTHVLGELLGDLEQEIREEANSDEGVDREVMSGLMGKLEQLRVKTSELHVDCYKDDAITGEDNYILINDEFTWGED